MKQASGPRFKKSAKLDRAMARLHRGHSLNRLPDGQYKFGGNKFIPSDVASACLRICGQGVPNNRGWIVFKLDPEALA